MMSNRLIFTLLFGLSVLPSANGIFFLIAAAAASIPAIGFTAGGVAAGSLAAAAQSMFYGGATAGVFSALQSAGATGAWATYAGVSAAAGIVTSAASKKDDKDL